MSSDGTHDKWGNNLPPGDMGKFPPPLRDARQTPKSARPQRHPGVPPAGDKRPPKRPRVRSAADEVMDQGMGKNKGGKPGGGGGKKKDSGGICLIWTVAFIGTGGYVAAGAVELIRWVVL